MEMSDADTTQKNMFQIQMNNAQESMEQSDLAYQTNEPGTEYKVNDQVRCRLDMDARTSKRSVKFGGGQHDNDDDSEQPSDDGDQSRELKPVGDESPGSMDESEYDPRLEQKIEQIKMNLRTGSNSDSHTNTRTQAVTTSNKDSGVDHQKNVSKLEEVLKRQRERLEQIQGQFALSKQEIREVSPDRTSRG